VRFRRASTAHVRRRDTVGEFGERYGTGSGSDLAPSEVVAYKAPGRYRSLYRTNSPTVSGAPKSHSVTGSIREIGGLRPSRRAI